MKKLFISLSLLSLLCISSCGESKKDKLLKQENHYVQTLLDAQNYLTKHPTYSFIFDQMTQKTAPYGNYVYRRIKENDSLDISIIDQFVLRTDLFHNCYKWIKEGGSFQTDKQCHALLRLPIDKEVKPYIRTPQKR